MDKALHRVRKVVVEEEGGIVLYYFIYTQIRAFSNGLCK